MTIPGTASPPQRVPDCRDCPWVPRMIDALTDAGATGSDVAGALRGFTSWWNIYKAECMEQTRKDAADAAVQAVATATEAEAARVKAQRGFLLALAVRLRPALIAFLQYGLPPLIAGGLAWWGGAHFTDRTVEQLEAGSGIEVRDVQP